MEKHEEINAFKEMIYCKACLYWYEAGSSCGCDTGSIKIANKSKTKDKHLNSN